MVVQLAGHAKNSLYAVRHRLAWMRHVTGGVGGQVTGA